MRLRSVFHLFMLHVQRLCYRAESPRLPVIQGVKELMGQAKRLLDPKNYNVIG
jgi:hypothetical protein